MARLDLIRFDTGEYGLQEVNDEDALVTLWDHEADQLAFGMRSWTFVRTLAEGDAYDPDDRDDFWNALEGVVEITPRDNP
jgi:hypothetical protein